MRFFFLACAMTFAVPVTASAQDMFGRAVAVVDDAVLVVKPLVGVGSATVYVFKTDGSEWSVERRLRTPSGSVRGEGFSGSVAWSGTALVVASGDPDVRWAAHTFVRDPDLGWASQDRVPLDPESVPTQSTTPPEVTLGTVMSLLQPPQRIVAARGEWLAVGIRGSSNAAPPPVRLLQRTAEGSWTVAAELSPDDMTVLGRFGSALAMGDGVLAVGAPSFTPQGSVWIYRLDASRGWVVEAELRADDLPAGARFGGSVAFADDRLLVGAQGTPTQPGLVAVFTRDADGAWSERERLRGPDASAGDGFGATLATSTTEAWVGAPGRDERRGAVARFRLDEPNVEFLGWVPATDLEPGFGFGAAISVGPELAVIGAPTAHSGTGAAAVYTRSASGEWSDATWLNSDEQLEPVVGGQVDCSEEGMAAGFDCDDVDLLAFLPLSALGAEPGERVSDVWGWTDPESRREYALVGRTAGMAIVDVTDASNPTYLGLVPANPSGARDIKVYQDHAFFTGDGAGEHGLVVFDLRRLRDITSAPVELLPDARYDGIASAHNLVLDTDAGFAYPVGASGGGETCGGGLHMVDVRDPRNPSFAGCFTDTEGLIWEGRTHDAQCTVYRGPDLPYHGREICFVSNETALRIVDVTDKKNPVPLGSASYPGVAYIHQGWLTDDQRYFFLNDELDELVGTTERTRTLIWDVSELDDPVLASDYFGPNASTDHNLYIKGDRMYQANYQAGFRVLDISDPEAPVEVGYFDTTPYDGDPPGFVGAWTAFPYFDSGTVVVSSMHEGLFLLKPRRKDLIP